MKVPKRLLMLGAAGLVAVAAVTPVLAMSSGGGATTAPAAGQALNVQVISDEARPAPHRHWLGHPGIGPRNVLGGIAEILGMDPSDLKEQVRGGATLQEVIEGAGSTVEQVVDELAAELQAKLDEAVANGRITQEQADQCLAMFREMTTRIIESGIPKAGLRPLHRLHHHHHHHMARLTVRGVADVLGMEPGEVATQLREGATMKEVIEGAGSTVEQVAEELAQRFEERISAAFENGWPHGHEDQD